MVASIMERWCGRDSVHDYLLMTKVVVPQVSSDNGNNAIGLVGDDVL